MFKKPMGFVKKTRTQVGSSAISQAVGVTGTAFSANTAATASRSVPASPPHNPVEREQPSYTSEQEVERCWLDRFLNQID